MVLFLHELEAKTCYDVIIVLSYEPACIPACTIIIYYQRIFTNLYYVQLKECVEQVFLV